MPIWQECRRKSHFQWLIFDTKNKFFITYLLNAICVICDAIKCFNINSRYIPSCSWQSQTHTHTLVIRCRYYITYHNFFLFQIIGLDECLKRLEALVKEGLSYAALPTNTVLEGLVRAGVEIYILHWISLYYSNTVLGWALTKIFVPLNCYWSQPTTVFFFYEKA